MILFVGSGRPKSVQRIFMLLVFINVSSFVLATCAATNMLGILWNCMCLRCNVYLYLVLSLVKYLFV